MSSKEGGDSSHQEKASTKVVTLDDTAILEAIIHYIQEKQGKGEVVDVEWLLEPEEGFELPPIKGIAVRCTLE